MLFRSGHLNHVDKITSDRSQPANRIDLNSFLAPLKGGPPPTPNLFDPVNKGYIPEQMVQSMQPDINVNLVTSPVPQPVTSLPTPQPIIEVKPTPSIPVNNTEFKELSEDLKSIKATLLKIDGTFTKIAGMMGKVFNFITEKEKFNK